LKAYVIRRVLLMIPVLVGVTMLSFLLLEFVPGDICDVILSRSAYAEPIDFENCRERFGLNDSPIQRYFAWLGGVVRLDFGDSYWTNTPIADELTKRIPISVELAVLSVFFSTILGIAIGLISATRQDSFIDYAGRVFSIIGLSIPNFVIGTILLLFLAIQFEWIPPVTYQRLREDPWGNLQQFIFPSLLLGFGLAASIARMTRSTMLEVLRQDYIRTAWAKGLRERSVIMRHALRNAMIPVITIVGLQFGVLLGGEVVMEILFGLPGIGYTLVYTVLQKDLPFLQALILITAAAYVTVNLLVDLSYGFLDPRVRYS